MTTEELVQKKVDELMDLYKPLFYHKNTKTSKTKIIKAAIITCNQILNDGKMLYCGNGSDDAHYKFWIDVKYKLNNLYHEI